MENNFYHLCLRKKDRCDFCSSEIHFDLFTKSFALAAIIQNISIVCYCQLANHTHILVKAKSEEVVRKYASNIFMRYTRYLKNQCFRRNTEVSIKYIGNEVYLKNTIAYIINNAKDAGYKDVLRYPWSSARSMFVNGEVPNDAIPVSSLTIRELRNTFHSEIDRFSKPYLDYILRSWYINSNGFLEPFSFCDCKIAESVFNSREEFM